jgi:hypothetical protein
MERTPARIKYWESLKGKPAIKFTQEIKDKISKRLKGRKGKPYTEERKKEISERNKRLGIKPPGNTGRTRFKKGLLPWNKDKKMSPESCKKLSESRKGYRPTIEVRKKLSEAHKGEKSSLWRGGRMEFYPENERIRKSFEYKLWRKAIFERDKFTCQKTGVIGGKLVAHHINNFNDFPELRLAIDNGITLLKIVHIAFHKKYGKQNNTREQLLEFLNNDKT